MCRKRLFKTDFKEKSVEELEFENDKNIRVLVLN